MIELARPSLAANTASTLLFADDQDLLHDRLGLGVVPPGHELVVDERPVAGVDARLDRLGVAVAEQERVVVLLAAVQHHDLRLVEAERVDRRLHRGRPSPRRPRRCRSSRTPTPPEPPVLNRSYSTTWTSASLAWSMIVAPEPVSRLVSTITLAPSAMACSACDCCVAASPSAFTIVEVVAVRRGRRPRTPREEREVVALPSVGRGRVGQQHPDRAAAGRPSPSSPRWCPSRLRCRRCYTRRRRARTRRPPPRSNGWCDAWIPLLPSEAGTVGGPVPATPGLGTEPMPWRSEGASHTPPRSAGAPASAACQARPHEGRADRGPRTRRRRSSSRRPEPGPGEVVDPRRRGGDLRDRPTAREAWERPCRGSRVTRWPACSRTGPRSACSRTWAAAGARRARSAWRTDAPTTWTSGSSATAAWPSGSSCPSATSVAARRVPVRPRALDRAARVLPPRRRRCSTWPTTTSPSWWAPARSGSSGCGRCRRRVRGWRSCNGPRPDDASRPSSAPTRCSNPATTSPRRSEPFRLAALVTAPGVEALSWAIDHVDVGGRVHAFAGTPGGAPVDANIVHYRHLRLVGSTGSTVEDYRRARDLARSGAVPLDRTAVADGGARRGPADPAGPPTPTPGCCGSW